jgi:hypothetical protein
MSNITPFGLSRIEAEGWRTAHEYLPTLDRDDVRKISELNPYQAPLERERWYAGFNKAMAAAGGGEHDALKDGWSVVVTHPGKTVATRHFVVAIADEAGALRAVEQRLAEGEVAAISSPVPGRLLDLRNMTDGEVRQLGARPR